MDKYKLLAWGVNKEALAELRKNGQDTDYAVSSALIFYADGTSEYVEFPTYDDFMNLYNEVMANGLKEEDMTTLFDSSRSYLDLDLVSQSGIALTENTKAAFLAGKSLSPETRERVIARIEEKEKALIVTPKVGEPIPEEEEVVEKEEDKFAKGAAIAASVIGAGVIGVGAGLALANDEEPVITPIVSETIQTDTKVEVPSMVDKDFTYYKENALETTQKDFFVNKSEVWLNETNAQESWQRLIVDSEKAKELGYTDNEFIFGFTAEDTYNLALRFNDMTKEEYVTLIGGKELDVVSIMDDTNSMSNGALRTIISYYVCSDECDLNIDKVINFNEKEVAQIEKFEKLLSEYKTLDSEEKEKEAKEKMAEIKLEINEFAYNIDPELQNVKSYILRTILPACSIISQTHQYEDTITVTLYDTKNNVEVGREIKTDLFDEITMRSLVLGYKETEYIGAFDAESFLEEHGIDEKRYNLVNTDVQRSKADESCSGQSEKLTQVNDYLMSIKMFDLEVNNVDPENKQKTEYDKLTEGTYDPQVIIDMINNELINNNTYPKNINYFNTAYIAAKQMEYKNIHGITQGKVGDKVKVTTAQVATLNPSTVTDGGTKWKDQEGNEVTEEEAKQEAREKEDKENGTITEEKAKEEVEDITATAQEAYDAAYNYFSSGNTGDLSEYANHENEAIRNAYNMAKEDGQEHYNLTKEVEADPIVGGEITPVNSETPTEPVEGITTTDPTLDPEFKPVVTSENITETPVVSTVSSVETSVETVENTVPTTTSDEGIVTTDPTLEAGFKPVVVETENSITDEEIQNFASEYPELFGEVENTEENIQENTESQGYSK